jgi:hypothetical protein
MYGMADLHRILSLSVALGLALIAAAGLAPSTMAQDQPSLPDIAPREIEIQGTLEIALPSLQRQPLSGFNPPPRIPDVPANRMPYVGSYTPDREDLPLQMPEPPGLQAQLDRPAPPLNGELRAGGGRYFSRYAAGQLWLPLSAHELVTIDGDYRGSVGFAPFENRPDVDETPYDTFTGRVGLQSRRESFSLNTDLEGFFDTYTLYGAQVNTLNPQRPSIVPQPDRSGRHLQGTFDVQTHGSVALGARASVSGTEYETTLFSGTPNDDTQRTERRVHLGGDVTVPIGSSQGRLDAMVETAGLGADGGFGNDVTAFDGGLSALLITRPGLRLHVGGRFLSTSVAPDARPDFLERRSARFFAPSFKLDWTASSTMSLFLQNQPSVQTHPLVDLFGENPYLIGAVGVQPSLRTTDAEGGLRLFAGPLQLVARGGYRYAVARPYMTAAARPGTASPDDLYAAGTFVTQYASSRIIHAAADLSLQRMGGIEISVGGAFRNGQLVEREVPIPYFAPVTGHAVVSYAFAEQRGLIQLTGRVESARYVDRSETERIDPFADVDLEASFDVTPSLGLIFEMKNMTSGSLEHWEQYPQPPLIITSGLRVRW